MTYAATAFTPLPALPLMCGRAGDSEHGDMNRDWECGRSARIYTLHGSATQITDSIARLSRLNSDFRRRNLIQWITEATARHERLVAQVLADLPACTHRDETRGECTVEGSLPDCTCEPTEAPSRVYVLNNGSVDGPACTPDVAERRAAGIRRTYRRAVVTIVPADEVEMWWSPSAAQLRVR